MTAAGPKPQETKAEIETPGHLHSCQRCRFLCTDQQFPGKADSPIVDIYACPGSGLFGPVLKRRWGPGDDDVGAIPVMYADNDIRFAKALAIYIDRSAKARAAKAAAAAVADLASGSSAELPTHKPTERP